MPIRGCREAESAIERKSRHLPSRSLVSTPNDRFPSPPRRRKSGSSFSSRSTTPSARALIITVYIGRKPCVCARACVCVRVCVYISLCVSVRYLDLIRPQPSVGVSAMKRESSDHRRSSIGRYDPRLPKRDDPASD